MKRNSLGQFVETNITNKRFGKLIALKKVGIDKWNTSIWLVKCDCGSKKRISLSHLLSGDTLSCGNHRNRLTDKDVQINHLFSRYKSTAKYNNILFSLSKSEFFKLITSRCYYCGTFPKHLQIKFKRHISTFPNHGLDRLIPSLGYKSTNVVSCCWGCNRMKNNMSHTQFLKSIKRIYNNFLKINKEFKNKK